ncbi:MAG TPA: hypothetical protein GX694_07075 [Actinomycetales bacterium]|nr:hypothetical protein [Actinomycetales bacterium]
MPSTLLAEAGLSECVREGVCAPDLGSFPAIRAAAGLVLTVWFAVVLYATVDVLLAGQGAARAAAWLLAVWLLPVVGVIAWFRSGRAGSGSSPTTWRSATATRPDRTGTGPVTGG